MMVTLPDLYKIIIEDHCGHIPSTYPVCMHRVWEGRVFFLTFEVYWGNQGGSVGSAFDSGPMCCWFESHPRN